MTDIPDSIAEIYDAIGDVERWRRLTERLSATQELPAEIQWHLEIGQRAHAQHVDLTAQIGTLMTVHDQLAVRRAHGGPGRAPAPSQCHSPSAAGEPDRREARGRTGGNDECGAINAVLYATIERASSALEPHAPHNPFVLVTRADNQPLSILVLRPDRLLARLLEPHRAVALLLIDPALSPLPGSDVLRGLFGFTVREAELAALLMKGMRLEEAAHALGVAISTARTFLAHITAKTDSHSQSELMKGLLAIPHVT